MKRTLLEIGQILAWSDAQQARTGMRPTALESAPIFEAPAESWRNIDQALRLGLRGLPGGSSLARLLTEQRGVRKLRRSPKLGRQILVWADAHQQRTGKWPTIDSGPIAEAPGETWSGVDRALRRGLRGLPGGSSLARLLAERRGVRNRMDLPELSVPQILAWADAHYERHGKWPNNASGPIPEAPGEKWSTVATALNQGGRGLLGGSSLARLLAEQRGVRNRMELPPLTLEQILGWADAHQRRTGKWPTHDSGPLPNAPGENWSAINTSLEQGHRGLPGGSSLLRLLAERRGVRNPMELPPLTPEQILGWADAHQRRTGKWPHYTSGPIADAPGETWAGIDSSLREGRRGLAHGSSLALFLAERRDIRNIWTRPNLTVEGILAWVEAHQRRTGQWPRKDSGPILEAPGEKWSAVDAALYAGTRGLAGGSSLAQLLAEWQGVRNIGNLPGLTLEQILAWADAHQRRTGQWPRKDSGPVLDAPGEFWVNLDAALRTGLRGLAAGSSLARLLAERRGVRNKKGLPKLRIKQILAWADAHHLRTGAWPTQASGPIPGATETWLGVDMALRKGLRGFAGGSSLARILDQHRRQPKGQNSPRRARSTAARQGTKASG